MSSYLNPEQVSQMLRGINPKRVGTDGKGFSHVEAYEIRAHLNRILGFGRWSADVLEQQLVFEHGEQKQGKNGSYVAWSVCYRSLLRLTVCAPDGTVLATYTEGATGEAKNQPSRGDAHDLALKTSESQALKRAAFNLGDQFGLSLFNKGSAAALVRRTLVMPDTEAPDGDAGSAVDAHITEQLPREDEPAEPQPDPRTTSQPPATQPPAPPTAAEPPAEDAAAKEQERRQRTADDIRAKAVGERPEGYRSPAKWIAHLMGEAVKHGVLDVPVESLISPTTVKLKVFLEQVLKQQTAPEVRERSA